MNVQYRDIDIRDAERSFEEFFTDIGFNIPSGGLKFDGKIHRFQIGDKPNANGAYQFWPSGKSNDGRPNGWVRDWTDGDNEHKWQYRLDGCKVARPTQAEIDARREAQEQAEARAAEARGKAIEIARRYYEGSPSGSREHPTSSVNISRTTEVSSARTATDSSCHSGASAKRAGLSARHRA